MTKGKKMKVTISHKSSGKEFDFDSLTKASRFMNISAMQLSRIIRGKSDNLTAYYVTTD